MKGWEKYRSLDRQERFLRGRVDFWLDRNRKNQIDTKLHRFLRALTVRGMQIERTETNNPLHRMDSKLQYRRLGLGDCLRKDGSIGIDVPSQLQLCRCGSSSGANL